jgi:hypothetical protein
MGLKKKSKAPAPPDPTQVAQQQSQLNRDAANYTQSMNRGSTTTPLGSQSFNYRGTDPNTGAPIYDETVSLAPEQQALLTQQTQQNQNVGNLSGRLLGGVEGAYSQPVDTSGLPQIYGADDLLGARKEAQDSVYNRYASYLDPQYQERERGLDTTLANKGVVEGSEAYNNARSQFGREREFDYGQARNAAVTGGTQEMQALYGMSADARGRGMNELLTLRDRPFEEFQAVSGMRDPVQLPQFQSPSETGVGAADITNPIYQSYQGQLDAYNSKQAGKNALVSGLFGLGGAVLGGPVGGMIGKKIGEKVG